MKRSLLIQGALVAFLATSCTDYVQQMEEVHELNVLLSERTSESSSDMAQSSSEMAVESSSSNQDQAPGKEGEVLSSSFDVQSSSDEVVVIDPIDSIYEDTVTLKQFPVMLFDWLHGNKGDGENGNGNPEYGISADFGSGGCGGSNAARKDSSGKTYRYMAGMVEPVLGPNGVPVRAAEFPSNCRMTEHLNYWFMPESLAIDAQGNTLTNMTCRDIYVSRTDEGNWLAEISKDNLSRGNEGFKGGMFLLDDFKYLDSAAIIPNPYYDELRGGVDNRNHNFGFTMKIQATFKYEPGQYFEFLGDDDVWVFINNRLAVDIGGQHAQVAGSVDLDTLGLVPGETYPFHIFYAERHTSASNFRMYTSINLKPEPCGLQ